LLFRVFSLQPA